MAKRLSLIIHCSFVTLAFVLMVKMARSQQAGTGSNANASSPAEVARIQAYLDLRYSTNDVWRTFEAKSGQIIDCIDWFAQPGVRAMAAKGKPITRIPTPPPLPKGAVKVSSIPDWALNGALDKNGVPRTCAPNGVAMVRITVADILAAGGLDAYLARQRHHTFPDDQESTPNFAHVKEKYTGSSPINFGQSIFSINNPSIPAYNANGGYFTNGSHSIAQFWLSSGTGHNYIPFSNSINPCPQGSCLPLGSNCTSNCADQCTAPCLQTVEVGWDRECDNCTNNNTGPNPTFFVSGTNDGYYSGCAGDNSYCFIPIPGGLPEGYVLPAQVPGTNWQQNELNVIAFNDYGTWWIWANNSYIGYFKSIAMGGDADFFTGEFQNSAQSFEAGGEVCDATGSWVVPMGSGAAPWAGLGEAAYMHDFMVGLTSGDYSHDFLPKDGGNFPSLTSLNDNGVARGAYTYSEQNNPDPSWANIFWFGNYPGYIWGYEWNYENFNNPSWIPPNVYAGQCGMYNFTPDNGAHYYPIFQPVIGVSKASWYHNADALLCGMNAVGDPNDPYCNHGSILQFGYDYNNSNAQECQTGNWDPHIAKGECPCNEYVAGVYQDLGGALEGLLCCQGRYPNSSGQYQPLTHNDCDVQLFYSDNSSAFYAPPEPPPAYAAGDTSPDWDPYSYKGQCMPGQYVAGISSVVWSSDGVPGAPHALFCCSD